MDWTNASMQSRVSLRGSDWEEQRSCEELGSTLAGRVLMGVY